MKVGFYGQGKALFHASTRIKLLLNKIITILPIKGYIQVISRRMVSKKGGRWVTFALPSPGRSEWLFRTQAGYPARHTVIFSTKIVIISLPISGSPRRGVRVAYRLDPCVCLR